MSDIEQLITEMVAQAINRATDFQQPRWVVGWPAIAQHLGIAYQTAVRWADKGTIRVHRKGKIVMADLNELDKCIKRL